MANHRYPLLAREGWVHTAAALIAAGAVQALAGGWWATPLWIFVLFTLQFFRDPPRQVPNLVRGVLCPADGRVIAIDEVEDPYLKRPCRRVSIFMNAFNVHSNRAPVEGKVMERWYHPGSFVNAALDKASRENERNAIWVKTDTGDDVVAVQVAGLIARRILCYVQPGDRVALGQRYGFIRFGSRVDLYLPPACRVTVSLGDKVRGALTTIAELPR